MLECNPIGKNVILNKICRNYPLKTRGYEFSIDLTVLPFDEFNVILGMDWLTTHDAVISCK